MVTPAKSPPSISAPPIPNHFPPKPTITGRDFVIANIQAPSGLKSSEEETSEETTDDPDTDTTEETDTD